MAGLARCEGLSRAQLGFTRRCARWPADKRGALRCVHKAGEMGEGFVAAVAHRDLGHKRELHIGAGERVADEEVAAFEFGVEVAEVVVRFRCRCAGAAARRRRPGGSHRA